MIFRIFLSVWVLTYVTMVIEDNAPCDNSWKKLFLFLSSYIWGVTLLILIWASKMIAQFLS